MAGLNLLPWRDKDRKRRRNQFFALLGVAAGIAAGMVFMGHLYMNAAVDNQVRRNALLNQEIVRLDTQIENIKRIDSMKQSLLSRMRIIESLQSTRPAIVHLFDEMATALPDGMYLERLVQNETMISVEGKAESNARVSGYMNRLDRSPWLSSSNLNIISIAESANDRSPPLRNFKLDVKQLLEEGGEVKQ